MYPIINLTNSSFHLACFRFHVWHWGDVRKSKMWSLSSLPPLSPLPCACLTAEQGPVMTKPPFQNVLLLLLYFILGIKMCRGQVCGRGACKVFGELEAKCSPLPEEERGQPELPSSSGPSCHMEQTQRLCRWQDRAKQSPYLATERFAAHPVTHPPGLAAPGLSSQAL